ncbi:putative alpha beta-hydrolase protein [Neofusicoccum parvum]|nr:putative alpha beta-hydrolase protein [Neofusicoccum parvum]
MILILPLIFLLPSLSQCLPQQPYASSSPRAAPRVATPQGTYIGNASVAGVDQFLSIRYAEPPIGPLRFADPVAYHSGAPGNEVNVSSYGPGCLQDPTLGSENGLDEDCLTLNVVRPANASTAPGELLPVMVFIYGGANINGQIKWYNSTGLVQSSTDAGKPVIFVSMNYRLGGFGFLYNTLFQRSGNILNTGLKDQHLALQWVQANIARFGGDPGKVTLFGQSAGSFNAWMQMRYAAARGETGSKALFHAAILESGMPASLALKGQTPANGNAYLNATLAAVGCAPLPLVGDASDAAVLQCLRAVPQDRLAFVWFNTLSPIRNQVDPLLVQEQVGFAVDGVWIDTPYYWADEVVPIPLITGTVLNEGSFYGLVLTGTATNPVYLGTVVATDLNSTDPTLPGPVVSTYFAHSATENGKGYNPDPTLDDSYYIGEAVLGDTVQNIPRRVLLGQHASSANAVGGRGAPTWGYMFKQRPPISIYKQPFYPLPPALPDLVLSRAGVAHASELAYVYGTISALSGRTAGDLEVSRKIQAMWFSFAYSKNPNSHGQANIPRWEKYDPLNARIFQFQEQGGATSGMASDSMRLDSYYWLFGSVFYTLTLGLTKISLVAQYLRIFSATRATRLACICALCFLSVALIQAALFSIFLCVPVSFFWTRRQPGRCLDVQKLYMAQGILNVISDLVVITLPIPAFRSLKISRKEKIALIGIFALGSFGCVTSIVRLQYVIAFTELVDLSWTAVDVNVWSGCEAFVALTCAALPVLRSLVRRLSPRLLRSTGAAESAPESLPPAGGARSARFGKGRIALGSMSGERAGGKDGRVWTGVAARCSGDADAGWGEEGRSLSESERVLFAGV